MSKITAVLFDFIGTTVREKDPDTIMNCFQQAFLDNQLPYDAEVIRENRGQDKMTMIGLVLEKHGRSNALSAAVYQSFKGNVKHAVNNFIADPDAFALFQWLKANDIKIGLGTAMEPDLFDLILTHVGWKRSMFDYVGTAEDVTNARPHADMIFQMMTRLSLTEKKSFLKVGDTTTDIQEGKNAGVATMAIFAGTQPNETLLLAGPDLTAHSLAEAGPLILHKSALR